MDKIQNVKQLMSFQEELQSLYNRQSASLILVESDNLTRRIIEPAFQKIGFSNMTKMEPGKDFLNELVKSTRPLVIWYEIKRSDPVLDALLKIIPSVSQNKSVKLMFSGSVDDKPSLAKVLQHNHKNILLKPLEAKSIEAKILQFLQ